MINEGECFIRVSKHEKTDERTRPKAECLETLMKHEARVYEMAPRKGTI